MGGCGATQHEAHPSKGVDTVYPLNPSQDERSLSSALPCSACLSRPQAELWRRLPSSCSDMRPHNRPVLAFSRDLLRAKARAWA